MRVLANGGSRDVGSRIVRELAASGHDVYLGESVVNPNNMESALSLMDSVLERYVRLFISHRVVLSVESR
jgi:hypothetical protein